MGFTVSLLADNAVRIDPRERVSPCLAEECRKSKPEIVRGVKYAGVGSALTQIIPKLFERSGCACRSYAKQLDQSGIAWCRQNEKQIAKLLVKNWRRFLVSAIYGDGAEIADNENDLSVIELGESCSLARLSSVAIYPAARAIVRLAIKLAADQEARSNAIRNSQNRHSVVWVYWEGAADGEELRYSIRSAEKHVWDAKDFVICGDKPRWWHGPFIPSPRFNKQDAKSEFGSGRFAKWIDSAVKLQRIIDSDLVTSQFLWMYDDTFLLKPCSVSALAKPRAGGVLVAGDAKTQANRSWREVRRRTHVALSQRGLPVRDYSTHLPVTYDKAKLQQTLTEFECRRKARCVESLYMNHHHHEPTGTAEELLHYRKRITSNWTLPDKTIVNVGGFNKHVEQKIAPLFSEPASHERD